MQNIIKASVVNFKAEFADKKSNIDKITDYIAQAAKMGANIIVLPELCLTGYDALAEEQLTNKEKSELCEDITGKSILTVKAAAKKCGIYTIFGFGERLNEKFYNSAAVITPDGKIMIYRKMHLFGKEGLFFTRGNKPLIFDTPWGKTSMGICYDTYNFPELLRYYAHKGARLYLNPTAMAFENDEQGAKESFCNYYRATLEYDVINTGMFILSSNLTGIDKTLRFGGGSVIMGVEESKFKRPSAAYYAGSIENEAEGIFTAEINLSLHNPRLFVPSPVTGEIDFRPELYAEFYK